MIFNHNKFNLLTYNFIFKYIWGIKKLWRVRLDPTKTNVNSVGSPFFRTPFYLNGEPLKETGDIENLS